MHTYICACARAHVCEVKHSPKILLSLYDNLFFGHVISKDMMSFPHEHRITGTQRCLVILSGTKPRDSIYVVFEHQQSGTFKHLFLSNLYFKIIIPKAALLELCHDRTQ